MNALARGDAHVPFRLVLSIDVFLGTAGGAAPLWLATHTTAELTRLPGAQGIASHQMPLLMLAVGWNDITQRHSCYRCCGLSGQLRCDAGWWPALSGNTSASACGLDPHKVMTSGAASACMLLILHATAWHMTHLRQAQDRVLQVSCRSTGGCHADRPHRIAAGSPS